MSSHSNKYTYTSLIPDTTKAWHARSVAQTVEFLETDPDGGLTEQQVTQRQLCYGLNELNETAARTPLGIFGNSLPISCWSC